MEMLLFLDLGVVSIHMIVPTQMLGSRLIPCILWVNINQLENQWRLTTMYLQVLEYSVLYRISGQPKNHRRSQSNKNGSSRRLGRRYKLFGLGDILPVRQQPLSADWLRSD